MRILFYISGHGFGHAVRMTPVIQAVSQMQPEWRLYIRTTAPHWLFGKLLSRRVEIQEASLDSGAIEDSPLRINVRATQEALRNLIKRQNSILQDEIDWIQRNQIDLLVADTPWLAGDIAASCGIPGIGIGNFLWNWILEPLVDADPGLRSYLGEIEASYAKLTRFLRLPYSHPMTTLPVVNDVPMIAQGSDRTRSEVLSKLGLQPGENRPIVYWSLRGNLHFDSLCHAAKSSPEFVFAYPEYRFTNPPENTCRVQYSGDLTFADVMSVCDTVIAKPGYGIAAACALNQVNMLYSRRFGFREDDVLVPELAQQIRMLEIAATDLEQGIWAEALRELRSQPRRAANLQTNGAEVCAKRIAHELGVCSCPME